MLNRDKFYGLAGVLNSGPIMTGMPRVLNVGNYTPSAGPILFQDTFTAPDGTNLTTRGWTALSGTWTITSNKATKSAGSGQDVCYHDCGANGVFSCDEVLLGGDNDAGIVWNVGGGNYWLCILQATNSKIFYYNGSFNVKTADVSHSAAGSYAVEVTVSGDNIKVKINGVQVHDFTEASRANQTATGAGIRINLTSAGTTFDNFTWRALPGLFLPDRSKLCPGGPHYYLINSGTNTVNLGLETGTPLLDIAPNTIATVLLGTTKWWAYSKALGPKTVGSNGSVVRTVPVGYIPPTSTVTQPTTYDPIVCSGGWRRARLCGIGALANIWMLDTDVTPHFVDSVAVFKYQNICYYFKQSDKLQISHGFTLAGTDVTWYVDCDTCQDTGGGSDPTGGGNCANDDPSLPGAILVKVFDPDHPSDPMFNFTAAFSRVGTAASYTSGERFNPPGCCTAKVNIQCDSGKWKGGLTYSCLACPGGAGIEYSDVRATNISQRLPYIGAYPVTSYTVGSSGPDYHNVTVTVLGYL